MSEPFVIEQKQADGSYQQLIPLGYINRNEFDNGDFKINQRGVSGTISTPGYFIDRWKLVSGTVTLTANGLALNGTISQILPTAIGTSYATSVGVYSGTATVTYNNNTATGTITSSGGVIKWVKLEIGEVVTPFVPKKYGEEMSECLRYYSKSVFSLQKATAYTCGITFPVPMRISPTVALQFYAADVAPVISSQSASGLVLTQSSGTYSSGLVVASADL